MSALLLRGNALRLPFADESIDLVVTSPSYFGQRHYQDGGQAMATQIGAEPHPRLYLEAMWGVMHEVWRVLKPEGSAFVNLGDKRSGSGAPGTTSGLSGRPKYNATPGHAIPDDDPRRIGRTSLEGTHPRLRQPQVQGDRAQMPGGYIKAAFGRRKSRQMLPHRFAVGCQEGLADPCMRDHEHPGYHTALLPSERCRGLGWIVSQELVWDKPNGMPESVKDRCRDSHEYWFHFAKQPRFYGCTDALRTPHKDVSVARVAAHRADPGRSFREGAVNGPHPAHTFKREQMNHPAGAAPGSVWRIPTQGVRPPAHLGVKHFAAYPTEWPIRIITGWCPPGGVVLDVFGGTGTTALVADVLGRIGISLDLSADYTRLAAWRTTDERQRELVAERVATRLAVHPAPTPVAVTGSVHAQLDLDLGAVS